MTCPSEPKIPGTTVYRTVNTISGNVDKFVNIGHADSVNICKAPEGEDPLLRINFDRLIGGADYAVFAGRQDALEVVDNFIAGPAGLLIVSAPAGLGKTALLAQLARSAPHRFIHHFLSARYDQGAWLDEAGFLRNMLQQFDPMGGSRGKLDLPSLRASFRRLLSEPRNVTDQGEDAEPRILLVDALDEVSGWSPADYLPRRLPDGLHIIFSIRASGQEWRGQYDLPLDQLTELPLDGLDSDAVAAVFAATGQHASALIRQPGALDIAMAKAVYTTSAALDGERHIIRGADPLYVRFLAEDANEAGFTVSDFERQPRGFDRYLDRWGDELKDAAGSKPVQEMFAILTVAMGPLTRQDLAALIPALFEDPEGWEADHFGRTVLPRIQRMLIDGSAGYTLAHPRFGQYLASRLAPTLIECARKTILSYCRLWATHGSVHALTHYPAYLAASNHSELQSLYREVGYLEACIRTIGIDRVIGRLRSILAAALLSDLTPSLQLLEREAHHLRHPFPVADPGYAARQICLQALAMRDSVLAESARKFLLDMPAGQLVPRRTTRQSNPALIRTLAGHTSYVTVVAITRDGTRAIAGTRNSSVRVWDLTTGEELHTLTGHTGWVTVVTVTPDSTRALTGGSDGSVRVWDLTTGEELHTLTGHTGWVTVVTVTPDSTRALTGGSDGRVQIWDLATGVGLRTLAGHTGGVGSVVVSPDGTRALTRGADGRERVWDLATGKELHILPGHTGEVPAGAVTPDEMRALTCEAHAGTSARDLTVGKELHAITGHTGEVTAAAVTPDGTRALTGEADGHVRVWNLTTGAWHADGPKDAAATSGDAHPLPREAIGHVRVQDLAPDAGLPTFAAHIGGAKVPASTPDGTRALIASSSGGSVRVCDLTTGEELYILTKHIGGGLKLAEITPDGTRAVTCAGNGIVKVWDLAARKELHTLAGHAGGVTSVAVTNDATRALTAGGLDGTVRVWDLVTGEELHILTGHADGVTVVAATPDSTRAVSGARDGSVRVWDLASGDALQVAALESSIDSLHVTESQGETTITLRDSSKAFTVLTVGAVPDST